MNSFPIVLYFPYPSVGGVSVLFLRIAKLFSRSHRVILMDLEDGYMAQNIPEGVEFLAHDKKELVPYNSVIVIQGVYPSRIRNFKTFPSSCRVMFWHLHPDNYFPYLERKKNNQKYSNLMIDITSFTRLRIGKNLIRNLLEKNALVFMDQPNVESTSNYYKLNLDIKNFLKIFTDKSIVQKRIDSDVLGLKKLHFGWIGRLEDFKTPILLHTLDRLKTCKDLEFQFTIIGKGKDSVKFRRFSKNCSEYELNIIEEIKPEEISSYLSKFDILFAMGTSALEGAKIGIPTFLLDYSFHRIDHLYNYELLYQKQGFSLAEPITQKNIESQCSLYKKISYILENAQEVSNNCSNYWKTNFSPIVFKEDFKVAISKSSMTVEDLTRNNYHKPDIITKILFKIKSMRKKVKTSPAWQY